MEPYTFQSISAAFTAVNSSLVAGVKSGQFNDLVNKMSNISKFSNIYQTVHSDSITLSLRTSVTRAPTSPADLLNLKTARSASNESSLMLILILAIIGGLICLLLMLYCSRRYRDDSRKREMLDIVDYKGNGEVIPIDEGYIEWGSFSFNPPVMNAKPARVASYDDTDSAVQPTSRKKDFFVI